jgi:hypothetical protein
VTTERASALALEGLTQPVVAYNVSLATSQPALRLIEGATDQLSVGPLGNVSRVAFLEAIGTWIMMNVPPGEGGPDHRDPHRALGAPDASGRSIRGARTSPEVGEAERP